MDMPDSIREAQEKVGRAHARFLPNDEGFASLASQFSTAAQTGGAYIDPAMCQKLALDFASLSVAIIAIPTE